MSKLLVLLLIAAVTAAQQVSGELSLIETKYDKTKNETVIRLLPVKISGEKDKYHSLHVSPSFTFSGTTAPAPSIIDFELQTVVKGRLRTDLYVLFIIDGEKVFLSSNRWAVKRPIPGRVWMGERLVFRMPYETLIKLSEAKSVAITMDGLRFEVGNQELQAIREFTAKLKSIRRHGLG